MRNRYDQAGKRIIHKAIEAEGTFTRELEISPDAQRFDGAFTPNPESEALRHPRDLLDRLCSQVCAFEVFHAPPGPVDLRECIRKLLNLHHVLEQRDPPPALPYLWILSAGRPASGLDALRAELMPDFPPGVYAAPALLHMGIVLLNELPETRGTLLLRLLGAERTLRQAVAELKRLPPEAREVQIAMRILVECRIEIAEDPVHRTLEDEDFVMNTQEIVDAMERKFLENGRREGMKPLARQFERRLQRPLTGDEIEVLLRRLDTLGAERLGDVVLDLSPEALASWLAAPDAS